MICHINLFLFAAVLLSVIISLRVSAEEKTGDETECNLDTRLSIAMEIIESVRKKLPNDFKRINKDNLCVAKDINCTKCAPTPCAEKSTDCSKCDKDDNAFRNGAHDLKPLDCSDVYRSGNRTDGTYQVWPQSRIMHTPILVYCDMMNDGGGWTVIQRRGDFGNAADYFYKDWAAYKTGFGELEKEFWLGNDNLFALTNQRLYQIRFDMGDWESNVKHAIYDEFWIDEESEGYKLHVKGYSGTAGDSFSYHNGMKFSTKDRENDLHSKNCAVEYSGAWWYNKCHYSNLNGLYSRVSTTDSAKQVSWHNFFGDRYLPLKVVVMKIRHLSA